MKRFDYYLVAISFFHSILFFRFVSLITSGSAIWALKQRDFSSILTTTLFATSFLLLFSNLAKLIQAFGSEEKKAEKLLTQVFKTTIGLMILYIIVVFITSSGIIVQTVS